MPALVVPGVSVEARFDVLPPLPAPSGVVGAVGIVDRPPSGGGLVAVTKVAELRELLGPGTTATLPEGVHALANGAQELVVAPVLGGGPASLTLLDRDGNGSVLLRCRSNGAWGNGLAAEVREIANAAGDTVRVTLRLLRRGKVAETFPDLQMVSGMPDDLFAAINGRSALVVAVDPGLGDKLPAVGTFAFDDAGTPIEVKAEGVDTVLLKLVPGDGISAEGLSVRINAGGAGKVDVQVFQGGLKEELDGLVMNPDSDDYLPYALVTRSRYLRAVPQSTTKLPAATAAPVPFENGTSPNVDAYTTAIALLEDDPRVNLVVASIEPLRANAEAHQIHQALLAHAVRMADAGAPRIAFGAVTADEQSSLDKIKDHAAAVRNRRFALVSPAGAAGAVAGAIARLRPEIAPTFKPVPLLGLAPASYRESQLNRLLGAATNLLVVQARTGRGVIVLKGIDTTGDQLSVTRVADQAIRATKAIAEGFIGRPNTADAKMAMRQQIVATFTRMEREGALVPSADGADPAFLVDVYSTQLDFAQGIVRIDIAVRPVRATLRGLRRKGIMILSRRPTSPGIHSRVL